MTVSREKKKMADVWRSDEPRVPEELDCIGVVGKAAADAADAFAHGNGRIPAGWPDSSFLVVETSLVGANGSGILLFCLAPAIYNTCSFLDFLAICIQYTRRFIFHRLITCCANFIYSPAVQLNSGDKQLGNNVVTITLTNHQMRLNIIYPKRSYSKHRNQSTTQIVIV